MRAFHKLPLVICLIALPVGGFPQATTAITGQVVDEDGAVMPGVKVTLRSESDPAAPSHSTETDDDGHFEFPSVQPGTYTVEYELAGFRPQTREGVTVGIGQARVLSLVLWTGKAPGTPTKSGGKKKGGKKGGGGKKSSGRPPDDPGLAVVPVFFATDRAPRTEPVLGYGTARNPTGTLLLGRFDVSVPRDHRLGQVERPTIWTFWREDPAKHFVITSRRQLSYDAFFDDVRKVVDSSEQKDAFVFIHGFNVSFEGAVFRTAQIAYDLGFDGAPILYSWPSEESLSPVGYATDAANNDWTVPHLRWFLEDVAKRTGALRVHLIAHSMGNKALVNALNLMPSSETRKFAQVFLTAPDIDADTFVQLADAVRRNSRMATLYASANDKALVASKSLQTYRRAGDTTGSVLVVPGIDTVDVSDVDSDLVGHFYYGDNDSVIADMFLALSQSLPPAKRPRLRPVGSEPNRYWRFAR